MDLLRSFIRVAVGSVALAACVGDQDPGSTSSATLTITAASSPTGNSASGDPVTGAPQSTTDADDSTTTDGAATTDDPGPTEGGTGSSGGAPTDPHEACERYLECLAVTAPSQLPEAQQGFGPNGTCWDGPPASQQQCIVACQTALEDRHEIYPDEPACALCQSDEECGADMACEDGDCVEVIGPGCGDGIVQADETCDAPWCPGDCEEAPCNPFSHAGCSGGDECRFAWFNNATGTDCLPPEATLPKDGQSCNYSQEGVEYCAAGLVCAPAELIDGCPGEGCCTHICNLQEPDDCTDGRVCEAVAQVPYYETYVGVCTFH